MTQALYAHMNNNNKKSTWRREALSLCLQIPPAPTMLPFVKKKKNELTKLIL
jgi:hypothetical protein